MNTPRNNTKTSRDLVVISVIAIGVLVLSVAFDVVDRFVSWYISHGEPGEVEEVLVVLLVMGFALTVFSWRRWKEVRREMAERRSAEEGLRETNERFQAVLEASPAAILTLTPDGFVTMWNVAAERILGWKEEEVLGKFYPAVPEDKKEEFRALRERVIKGESFSGVEVRRKRKNGSDVDMSVSTAPMRDSRGNITGILAVIADISDRRKTEEALRESEARLRSIIETETDCVKLLASDGTLLEINPAGLAMIEADSQEEVKGRSLLDLLVSAYAKPFKEHISKVFEGDTSSLEYEIIGMKGTRRWLEDRSTPFRDKGGKIMALLGVTRDITDRKKAEVEREKLLRTISKGKKEWEMTFDSAIEFIVLVDKDLNVLRYNKSCADFLGTSISEKIGHPWFEAFPFGQEEIDFWNTKVLTAEPTEWVEAGMRTGQWLYISHRPVLDEKGDFLYSILIATDITAMKTTQERLSRSEEELKKRVKELEKFYDMAVGRELRMKELKKEIQKLNAEILACRKDIL